MVSKFGGREVSDSVWIGWMRTHRNKGEVVDVGVAMVPAHSSSASAETTKVREMSKQSGSLVFARR